MSWENDDNNPWGKKKTPSKNDQNPVADFIEWLKKVDLKSKKRGPKPPQFNPTQAIFGVFIFALFLWSLTGFYTIKTDEQGVILRLGKYYKTTYSGLNWKLPYPFDIVTKCSFAKVNSIDIGASSSTALSSKSEVLDDRIMLTGDENIVNVAFNIQWKIKDSKEYVLNTRFPESTLKVAGESVMREVIGQMPILPIVSGGGWTEVNLKAQDLLQKLADEYRLGIEVLTVKLQKGSPPEAVNEAFQDVQNARADKARLSNEAEAYRNDILPRARAEAIKIIQDAEAYQQSVVADAKGESLRFLSVLQEYKKNPEITIKRMQLNNMQKVFERNPKIIVDPAIGKNLLQVLPGMNTKETPKKGDK